MASESSFDIVNKVDRQEVDNALNQAAKEIASASTSRTSDAAIELSGEAIDMQANTEERAQGRPRRVQGQAGEAADLAQGARGGRAGCPGKVYKINAALEQGITQENAKKIGQDHPRRGPEGRQGADPGRRTARPARAATTCRRSIALLKGQDLDFALQFVNYR